MVLLPYSVGYMHSTLLIFFFPYSAIVRLLLSFADKAPAAIVGLVGHKEYEQCAKDLYYFIQVINHHVIVFRKLVNMIILY